MSHRVPREPRRALELHAEAAVFTAPFCLHHVPGGARLSRDYWLQEMEFTFLIKKDGRVCR
jgi:hypothetical protein